MEILYVSFFFNDLLSARLNSIKISVIVMRLFIVNIEYEKYKCLENKSFIQMYI